MSEASQADVGVTIKGKLFKFETCEEIICVFSNVRLLV
jgi:hypothetical protein